MKSIGEYRTAIGNYFSALDFEKDVRPFLKYQIDGLRDQVKIAYFDCFSGISGDMCLGALLMPECLFRR